MNELTDTHFYAPFLPFGNSSQRKQYEDLGALYHYLNEPPAEVPQKAVLIIKNTLLANPSLAAHEVEIEKKLKSGELLAPLMYKVKKVGPREPDEIISYGIGLQRRSLPSGTKKADDWEAITKEAFEQNRFY